MQVVRVYNNNALLARAGGTELVAVGRGIGFARKPGDSIDADTIEQRFVPDDTYGERQITDVLSDAPIEHVDLARQVVSLAAEALGIEPRISLLLPVLDHLTFAVRRAERGQRIDIPLRWEIESLYPDEAALGRRVVALVEERLRIELQVDEWAAFALHLVNQQWTRTDIARTMAMTESIPAVFATLADRWGRPVDERSRAAVRFVAHLRYLFVRVVEARPAQETRLDVAATVEQVYPAAAEAAREVAQQIGAALDQPLGADETAYLMLHVARLYEELGAPRGAQRGAEQS